MPATKLYFHYENGSAGPDHTERIAIKEEGTMTVGAALSKFVARYNKEHGAGTVAVARLTLVDGKGKAVAGLGGTGKKSAEDGQMTNRPNTPKQKRQKNSGEVKRAKGAGGVDDGQDEEFDILGAAAAFLVAGCVHV